MLESLKISFIQYLDEKGEVKQTLPDFAHDIKELLKLYEIMTLLKVFDAKAVAMQRTGKIGTYAGISGQEAVSVGIGTAMRQDDVLCPSYREYGAMIQRGVKLEDILAYWGGDERGSNFAHPEDFPISVPIASQCLHAAGVAYAFKYRHQKRVAVTVCGDGGTSKGDFYEAMNLAGDWKLPVVFVVNNNQWAISLPRSKQTGASTLAQKAIAAGFEGVQVDGNDVIAVRQACEIALEKAREKNEPTLIEAITYRLCDHTTADDAKRYCDPEELKIAMPKEPLIRLRNYLIHLKAWDANKEEKLKQICTEKVGQAVSNFQNMPPREPASMFEHLFANVPKAYQSQIAALTEEKQSHG